MPLLRPAFLAAVPSASEPKAETFLPFARLSYITVEPLVVTFVIAKSVILQAPPSDTNDNLYVPAAEKLIFDVWSSKLVHESLAAITSCLIIFFTPSTCVAVCLVSN